MINATLSYVFATKHKHTFRAQPRGQPPNHIVRGPSNLTPCLRSIRALWHILNWARQMLTLLKDCQDVVLRELG